MLLNTSGFQPQKPMQIGDPRLLALLGGPGNPPDPTSPPAEVPAFGSLPGPDIADGSGYQAFIRGRLMDALKSSDSLAGRSAALDRPTAPNPYALNLLSGKSDRAKTSAQIAAMKLKPPTDYESSDFDPADYGIGKRPTAPSLDIPGRPAARVNPLAALLAGVGGFVAPRGAAHFSSQLLQGAIDHANQQHQDALRVRQMKLEELDRAHTEELAMRNEALKIAESNFAGDEKAKYLNWIGKNEYDKMLADLEAKGAGQDVENEGLGMLSAEAQKQADLAKSIAALKDSKASADANVKALTTLDKEISTSNLNRDKLLEQIRGNQAKEDANRLEKAAQERNRVADNLRADRAENRLESNAIVDNRRADAALGISGAHLNLSKTASSLAERKFQYQQKKDKEKAKDLGPNGEKIPTGGEVGKAQGAWIAATKARVKEEKGTEGYRVMELLEKQRAEEFSDIYKARYGYYPWEKRQKATPGPKAAPPKTATAPPKGSKIISLQDFLKNP